MTGRAARWGPTSGVVFAVLFVAALALFADVPAPSEADAKLVSYVADHSHQVRLEAAFLGATIGMAFFFWFVGILAARLASVYGRIAVASGAAAGVLFLLGLGCNVALVDVAGDTDAFRVDPNTARLASDFSYTLIFEAGLPFAAPLVLAASLGGGFAAWLRRSGYVVAVGCILGFLAVGMALFILWVVAVSVVLTRGARQSVSSPDPVGS